MSEIAVRRAVVADAAAIAGVHVRSWQVGYRGIVPDAVLEAQSLSQRTGQWSNWLRPGGFTTLVAQAGATIVGFAAVHVPSPDTDLGPQTCELAALYVDPDCWRRRVGRTLMDAAMELGRAEGSEEMSLWVLVENSAARAFYETVGFAADGAANTHERSGEPTLRMRARLGV
ncbi:MAG: GNAT family N-acetyltransferase [Solirubrobacteraceae bacterium]